MAIAVPLGLSTGARAGGVVAGVAAVARPDGRGAADLALGGREDGTAATLSQVLNVGAVAAEKGCARVLGRDGHGSGGGEEEEGEELGHVGWLVDLS